MTGYISRWFTRPQMVTHPSTNLAVHSWKSNSQPVDHKSDALTTTPPSHLLQSCFHTSKESISDNKQITLLLVQLLSVIFIYKLTCDNMKYNPTHSLHKIHKFTLTTNQQLAAHAPYPTNSSRAVEAWVLLASNSAV